MKLTDQQRRDFVAAVFKKEPEVLCVEVFAKVLLSNREMWRTCKDCGEHFDAIKTRELICPKCGSLDLEIG